jgi:hypothetical protein
MPAITGSTATAMSPPTRATELFAAEANPECSSGTAPSAVVEWVTVFPDHLEVTVVGSPPLNVLFSEVGLKES